MSAATIGSASARDAGAGARAVATYRVLGGVLRSALALPGLESVPDDAADWTLDVVQGAPRGDAESAIGVETLDVGSVTLSRVESGYRLRYEDTGCFDVSADGARITWYEAPDADPELVRIDVCGRVLAMALHAAGAVCLHASAVATPGGAIGFVAPKAHGKSSLAAALLRRGLALLTDDTLPVLPGPTPRARPGLHQLRLNRDSAHALLGEERTPREVRGGKHVVDGADGIARCDETLPLAALYELAPVRALDEGEVVRRVRVTGPQAAITLVRHVRPAALLGGAEAAAVLARVAAIAARVPVYRLSVAAGLDRLDDVAAQVLAWHASASAA